MYVSTIIFVPTNQKKALLIQNGKVSNQVLPIQLKYRFKTISNPHNKTCIEQFLCQTVSTTY